MNQVIYSEVQKVLYESKKKEPFFVDVPNMKYLKFDGSGHPSDKDYQVACEALYTVAYTLKFEIARKKLDIDFKVNPMEVTWYLDKSDKQIAFTWTMMLMQPDFISEEMVQEAIRIAEVKAEKKGKWIAFNRVAFGEVVFGRSIQCFHLGDYNRMNDTLAKMVAFARQNELECDQYTHDIYLNDMRKTKVENYKTIMRVRVR